MEQWEVNIRPGVGAGVVGAGVTGPAVRRSINFGMVFFKHSEIFTLRVRSTLF